MVQLKAELRRRGLQVSGTKKELIARLENDDPSGEWRNKIMQIETSRRDDDEEEDGEEKSDGERDLRIREFSRREDVRDDDLDIEELSRQYRDMRLEFDRRENELLRRELEIARRENEQLRRTAPPAVEGQKRERQRHYGISRILRRKCRYVQKVRTTDSTIVHNLSLTTIVPS